MDGSHSHKKCCFEFLLHDMKHMENFIDEDIHSEQVRAHRVDSYATLDMPLPHLRIVATGWILQLYAAAAQVILP
jgi:hypothetical protein